MQKNLAIVPIPLALCSPESLHLCEDQPLVSGLDKNYGEEGVQGVEIHVRNS